MHSLHELTDPISPEALKSLQAPLQNLQGNILRAHGRDHSAHIFLRFNAARQTAVKQWIKEFAGRLTSAQQQLEEAQRYRRHRIPGRVFMSFFLSAQGYEYLYPGAQSGLRFGDEAFLHGMKAAQHRLNDPPQDTWEPGYRRDIHALALLADDDELRLRREVHGLLDSVQACAEVCAVEYGATLRNAQRQSTEHFGYADGLSQPLFFQSDLGSESPRGERAGGWDPHAGPALVLVPDPYGGREVDGHGRVVQYHHSGSYLVFRKLEQRVRDFKAHAQKLAEALGLSGDEAQRAGALVMGRFTDGTPIVLQPTTGRPVNHFTYDGDPNGQKCPLQAHIRKVNPRQQGVARIVRRGVPYGQRRNASQDAHMHEESRSEGVGLLFMCYQRNIAQQFEVLQYLWANDPRLPRGREPGIDPVIGQPGGNGIGRQQWPARWGDPHGCHKRFDFHGFVTLKGGEYFFAPSLYFLRHIDPIPG